VGERYLLGHHNVSLSELLRVLAECSGKPSPRVCLPWIFVAVAGLFGELAGSGRICWETASHARRRTGYLCQKAAAELAWQPNRPLKQTVHEAVAWFRQRPDLSAAPIADLSVRPDVAC
jgi:dihydroflavonol-4-reductase